LPLGSSFSATVGAERCGLGEKGSAIFAWNHYNFSDDFASNFFLFAAGSAAAASENKRRHY
jgi:hypothetical protein